MAGNDLEGNFRGEVFFKSACTRVIPFSQLRVEIVPIGNEQVRKSEEIKIFLEKAKFDRNIKLNPSKKYQARLIYKKDESVLAKENFQVQKTMDIILTVSCQN